MITDLSLGQSAVYAPAEPWLTLRRGETCTVLHSTTSKTMVCFADGTKWLVKDTDLHAAPSPTPKEQGE